MCYSRQDSLRVPVEVTCVTKPVDPPETGVYTAPATLMPAVHVDGKLEDCGIAHPKIPQTVGAKHPSNDVGHYAPVGE